MANKKVFWVILAAALVLGVFFTSCTSIIPGGGLTVAFHPNGASGTGPASQVTRGEIILPGPEGFTNGDAAFGGWISVDPADGTETIFSAGSYFTPQRQRWTNVLHLYAKWELDAADLASVSGLANSFTWLRNNAQSGGNYVIEVNQNEGIGSQFFTFPNRSDITITIRGNGANWVVSHLPTSMFTWRNNPWTPTFFQIGRGNTLILENITLQGRSDNLIPLVFIDNDGELVMNAGAVITGNGGRGVQIGSFAHGQGLRAGFAARFGIPETAFTMNDGAVISGNNDGGVLVMNGTFTMNGGTIWGNRVTVADHFDPNVPVPVHTGESQGGGGGVAVGERGLFDMRGGEIRDNRVDGMFAFGGGVYANYGGRFTMSGGSITNNLATNHGGVAGAFTRTGGTISGNRARAIPGIHNY